MKNIFSSLIFVMCFFSCNTELKKDFVGEWIEGVPPKVEDVEYYKYKGYYVVDRTDQKGDGFVTNNKEGKDKVLIRLNYFDREKVEILLGQYEVLKEENYELINASYFKGKELSYMTTYLDGSFYHSYRYLFENGKITLVKVKEWDDKGRCYVDSE